MRVNREKNLVEIKDKLTGGSYRVDPYAVADAIVRRLEMAAELRAMQAAAEAPKPQKVCS
jgi:hypothetical protein